MYTYSPKLYYLCSRGRRRVGPSELTTCNRKTSY